MILVFVRNSKAKVETSRIYKVVLVSISVWLAQSLNEHRLKACKVVIELDWPKCDMLIERKVKSSTRDH